jgi:hypothetical protein
MRKHRRIWPAALVLAMICGVGWLLLSSVESEPVYQGKRLSAWLAELDKEMPRSNFSGTNGPAATAIQQIGTNAIPYLRWRLKATDSRLKTALMTFSSNHIWLRVRLTPADDLRRRAALAAFCLGPRGSPLMPDIMRIFRSTNYSEAFTVTEIMGRVGYCNPETLPTLLAALNEPPNASPGFHDRATLAFMQLYTCMEIVNVDRPDAFHDPGYEAALPALSQVLNAPTDMPLSLGETLKPYCGTILKRIDPHAAAKVGVK